MTDPGRESLDRHLTVWRLEVAAGPLEHPDVDRRAAFARWVDTTARVAYLSEVLARIDFATDMNERTL